MAHFAEIDETNTVVQVIVIQNIELQADGIESEAKGIAFCQSLFGGNWVQTSYNENMRKNYAGIGFNYDADRDAFIPPKPFNSWILDEETCQWDAPMAYPEEGGLFTWDEDSLSWVSIP